jgi:hypothetical protein
LASTVINSIQSGTIVISSGYTSATASITAVVVAKSYVVYQGTTYDSGYTQQNYLASLSLTNTTTVTATRNSSNGTLTVGYTVVEFK